MSRMFKSIDRTWNVYVGCLFECSYCNAKKAALTRFRHLDRYKDGFRPHLVESELKRTFKPGEFIFVAYMGDIFWAPNCIAWRILNRITDFPQTQFLIQSKDPRCFHFWECPIPPNVTLGTTIETNRGKDFGRAPAPIERYLALRDYTHPYKFLSIEPIMDFDLPIMVAWIEALKPDIIEVGADNYHNHLPEPSPEKVKRLLATISELCPRVIEKDGLERLKERR